MSPDPPPRIRIPGDSSYVPFSWWSSLRHEASQNRAAGTTVRLVCTKRLVSTMKRLDSLLACRVPPTYWD